MKNPCLRAMRPADLKTYYRYISVDFPRGEYPPYEILLCQLCDGRQQGFLLHDRGRDLAYAICAAASDHVLLSLLAVLPRWRGQGVGACLLRSLQAHYKDRPGIIAEVERPELARTREERQIRHSRLAFYRQAGFCLIAGIDYSIWSIPMHLMVCPLQMDVDSTFGDIESIMYEVYLGLSGPQHIHRLVINRDGAQRPAVRPETGAAGMDAEETE